MKQARTLLVLFFVSLACAASSLPIEKVAKFFLYQPPAGGGGGGAGAFNFITHAGTSGFTAADNAGGPVDMTGVKLITLSGNSYSADKMVVWDSQGNTYTAKTAQWTGNGTQSNQQFYCLSPTVSSSMYFVISNASGDGSLVRFVMEAFGCTGTPAFVSETGTGNSGATTLQPGSQTPASGTNLFVTSAGANDENPFSIDSGFSSMLTPLGDGTLGVAWKNSATAENPTWTFNMQGGAPKAAANMLMFSASGGICTTAYPIANSNLQPIITVTSDGTGGSIFSGTPTFLVDGDYTSNGRAFFPAADVTGHWVKFDSGSGHTFLTDEWKFLQQTSATQGTWQWQGSFDGSTWSNIGSTFTLGGATTQTITTLNGNTTAYRAYRILGISGTGDDTPWTYQFIPKMGCYQ